MSGKGEQAIELSVEEAMADALRNHTMKHSFFGLDAPLPLVDMLTPEGDTSIKRGQEEIEHLLESICETLPIAVQRESSIGWQPASTAPKDGSVFLVWKAGLDNDVFLLNTVRRIVLIKMVAHGMFTAFLETGWKAASCLRTGCQNLKPPNLK